MKRVLFILLSSTQLSGCYFGDNPSDTKHLTGNFYLVWMFSTVEQKIIYSNDKPHNGYIGDRVVDITVFAVGYNDNFIIVKQHPDKSKEIEDRLFDGHSRNSKEDYEIKNLSDTIYFLKNDSLYIENGKWYHTSHDFTSLPDSLKPYKRITYFHIIDTKKNDGKTPYTVYTFNDEKTFNDKRLELGVPEDLSFTIVNRELE